LFFFSPTFYSSLQQDNMRNKYFHSNPKDGEALIFHRNDENVFLTLVEQTLRIMQLNNDDPYSDIMIENIRGMCSEIEYNLDEFLQNLNISFRTDQFLLLLFNELYEYFVLKRQ